MGGFMPRQTAPQMDQMASMQASAPIFNRPQQPPWVRWSSGQWPVGQVPMQQPGQPGMHPQAPRPGFHNIIMPQINPHIVPVSRPILPTQASSTAVNAVQPDNAVEVFGEGGTSAGFIYPYARYHDAHP